MFINACTSWTPVSEKETMAILSHSSSSSQMEEIPTTGIMILVKHLRAHHLRKAIGELRMVPYTRPGYLATYLVIISGGR